MHAKPLPCGTRRMCIPTGAAQLALKDGEPFIARPHIAITYAEELLEQPSTKEVADTTISSGLPQRTELILVPHRVVDAILFDRAVARILCC